MKGAGAGVQPVWERVGPARQTDRAGRPALALHAMPPLHRLLDGRPLRPWLPESLIALAVRWYVRFRLSYVDVVEWLAERGCAWTAAPSTGGYSGSCPQRQPVGG